MNTNGVEIIDRVLIKYVGSDSEVVIDSDILSIADNAFSKNEFVETVEFQSPSLRTIGKEAFSGCKKLHEARFRAIKGGIGMSAFEGCAHLQSFIIPNGARWL